MYVLNGTSDCMTPYIFHKTLAWYESALVTQPGYAWYGKSDDDSLLNLPRLRTDLLAAGATAGVVESVKAASDIYAPVSVEVVAFNEALNDAPETINASPYNTWIFKLKANNAADVEGLLDAAGYQAVADAS
jgi:hypothetical protein